MSSAGLPLPSSKSASFSLYVCVALAVVALNSPTASAFCVYNDGAATATFLAWPPDARSFKKAVAPGDNECCNWKEASCFAGSGTPGQCDTVQFLVAARKLNTNAITANFIAKSVLQKLASIVGQVGQAGSAIPTVGSAISAAAAYAKAGLNFAAQQVNTAVPMKAEDKFVTAIRGGTVTFSSTNSITAAAPNGCQAGGATPPTLVPTMPTTPSTPATPPTGSLIPPVPTTPAAPPTGSLIPPVPATPDTPPTTPDTPPSMAPTALMSLVQKIG